jgi:predicted ATP-dependent endonuclease of OLD family
MRPLGRPVHLRRDDNPFGFHVEFHVHDLPRSGDPKNLTVKIGAFHHESLADPGHLPQEFPPNSIKSQEEIHDLLGRLSEKYEVSISTPSFDIEQFPFSLSLGDKHSDVPLEEWGSGTQNRTMIMLAILKAKKARETASESDRITPVIVIEEPECFLHPSAQAEFGRVIRDLSLEFKVQTIVTTHSPYMLSVEKAESNILLERPRKGKRLLQTEVIETSGDKWMRPFANALGVDNEDFNSWKSILFRGTDELLLVEGEGDKEYFKELQKEIHGANKLDFDGEIFAYGGSGFFSNTVLLKFLLNRFKSVIVTYDLDTARSAEKALRSLSLEKGKDYFSVGKDSSGHRDIEGLVPSSTRGSIYGDNPGLVTSAASAESDRCDARNKLKQLIRDRFIEEAKPRTEDYADFYNLAEKISKSFRRMRN